MGITYSDPDVDTDETTTQLAALTPIDNGVIIGNGAAFVVESGAPLRASLGLAIGSDVMAYDADLATWAGVTPGTGVATFLATPSSANLSAALTDELGSDKLVFSAGTLAVASGKTLTVSNTLTFTGTDSSTLNIGTGGTLGTAAYKATGTSGNTVPLLDGTNTWSGVQTTPAGSTVGLGAGQVYSYVKGGNSGTASGAAYICQGGGTTFLAVGNYSSIIGGAYDSRSIYYSVEDALFYTNGALRLTIGTSGIATFTGGITSGGARHFFSAAGEPYAVGLRYTSSGAYAYIGASNSASNPNVVISNTSGSAIITALDGRTVRFDGYGAGTLVTDSSGNITASSDERLKYITGQFTRGLADLRAMDGPVSYQWRGEQIDLAEAVDSISDTESKLATAQSSLAAKAADATKEDATDDEKKTHEDAERAVMSLTSLRADQQRRASLSADETTYTGWTAQGVRKGIPEAIKAGPDGMLNFDERPVLAACRNAILELEDMVAALTARLATLEAAQ